MKVSYNWLQTYFAQGALPSVAEIEQKLMFHAYEIEGVESYVDDGYEDSVIDVDILPNRSSDSMSHRGIAREIATQFELELNYDPLRESNELVPTSGKILLELESAEVCPIHTLALIKGVKVGESPKWLRQRLEAIGQKSINNVVDATNYVMFGLGQPSHVFDFDKLTEQDGTRGIRVRTAKDGEQLTLLGGAEVTMTTSMNVLADVHSDESLDVAGVKGGVHAELSNETVNVLVSAAKFHPTITRKTAQGLKLRTDASARYENETPDQMPKVAIRAVVQLIVELAGGELDGYMVAGDADSQRPAVRVSAGEFAKLLGTEIAVGKIEEILTRLGFKYERDGEDFTITAPFERLDVNIKEDVIEEVGRVYGYSNIEPKELDDSGGQVPILKKYALAQKLRKVLIHSGYKEVMLYSLVSDGEVKLKNSLNREKDHMRAALSPGVLDALAYNERNTSLLGEYDSIKIFEIGNIFTTKTETTNVCIGVRAIGAKKKESRTAQELADIKSAVEQALGIQLPEPVGEVLEFDLLETVSNVTVDGYDMVGSVRSDVQFAHMSSYPFIVRDIAVWAPYSAEATKGTADDVIREVIEKYGGELVQRIDKFDEFAKDGKVSLAFHIVFQSMEKTLTDDEVGEIMKNVEAELGGMDGFEVR